MFFNLFTKRLRISYGITVCNEAVELNNLLSTLIPLIDKKDEIIVLQDITNKNQSVDEVITRYKDHIVVAKEMLNNDFATFKNNFLAIAKGDYLFQIDADEIPQTTLIKKIKRFLKKKSKCDCFFVPRINIVNGYSPEHVKKWNWNINDKNYINFPDFQPRIIKLNGSIQWKNKVHEILIGYKRGLDLPVENYEYCLIHIKDIKRQESQNDFYEKLM
ncbi:MAG: hypothetical protein JWR38_1339 [Mucilaginibacter sp.]|nr:hypothetical protein [Mucilaginibacter sp.]